jgi:hypothetical protein
MTSQLALYNESLAYLGERKLGSLSENREPRRVLDDFYSSTVNYCLARGFWNFAMRAVSMTASATITPQFGYTFAFEKPSDWVRTFMVSDNENFYPLLARYNDEAFVIYCDAAPLYFKYVSNNASYGLNLAAWPETFADYVALRLAYRAAKRIKNAGADEVESLMKQAIRACSVAGGVDAMDEPPMQPPTGTWAQSRAGQYRGPRNVAWGR